MLDLKQNYFELFSLPVCFALNSALLTENYRALQQVVHPDRFATATPQEKRFSMQAASYINEAYQSLGNDLKRATYLLSMNNIDINSETDTKVDPMFLMSQMEYREQMEAVVQSDDPFADIDRLRDAINDEVTQFSTAVSAAFEVEDFSSARDTVRKWQFLEKLKQELGEVEHALEEKLDA